MTNVHAKVLICLHYTALPHIKRFAQVNADIVRQENIVILYVCSTMFGGGSLWQISHWKLLASNTMPVCLLYLCHET